MKFKVGDKVKIVGWRESILAKKGYYGTVDTISNIFPGLSYPYRLRNSSFGWRDDELELVESEPKYKIGDRVIIEKSNIEIITSFAGKVGVIKSIDYTTKTPWKYLIGVEDHNIWCTIKGLAPTTEQKIVITTDGKTTTAKLYEDNKVVKTAEAKCSPEDTFDFNIGAKLAFERLTDKYKPGDKVKVIDNTCYHFSNKGDVITLKSIWKIDADGTKKWEYYNPDGTYTGGYIIERDIEPYVEPPVEPLKRKFYNGKVICTANRFEGYFPLPDFTVGKIYEVVEGVITDDDGHKVRNIPTLGCLCAWTGNSFIPLIN